MIMIVCVHCGFLIWFSLMIFILYLNVLPINAFGGEKLQKMQFIEISPTIKHRRVVPLLAKSQFIPFAFLIHLKQIDLFRVFALHDATHSTPNHLPA